MVHAAGGRGRIGHRREQRAAHSGAGGSRRDEGQAKRVGFTRERKEIFLEHFAATANAAAAGRAAGVSKSTVYEHRRKDSVFSNGWYEALGEGYARVEAQSVRWAEKAFAIRASESAGKAVRNMDPKVALAILESYRRNGGRRPGEILPQPYEMDEVRARLEAKMRALGMIEEGGAEGDFPTLSPSPEGEGKGPSTASRSPSPGNPGEDK